MSGADDDLCDVDNLDSSISVCLSVFFFSILPPSSPENDRTVVP